MGATQTMACYAYAQVELICICLEQRGNDAELADSIDEGSASGA